MKTKSSKLEKDSEKVSDLVHVDVNDALTLPFPEWSDQEIHGENWKGPAVTYQKPDTSPPRSRDREVTISDASMKEEYHFVDEQKVYLPYSIVAYEWKAAAQVFPNATLEVYVDTDEYPDLIIGNKHLLHSEFMRSFISSVYMLTYLGNTTQFATEYVSPNFTPTTIGKPWRPWHHIYSNSLVGAKHPHEPTFNKTGKYIVRLFWMGAWRKIYVDDKLPIDMLNNVMLPTTAKPELPKQEAEQPRSARSSCIKTGTQTNVETKQEEKVVELWPFLLSKALLKVASLSWYEGKEIVHFDIVQCLTGWQPLRINTKGLAISNIWQMCWGYTNHYVCPPEEPSISSKFEKDEDKSDISAKAKGKKEKKAAKSVQVASEDIRSCHVMARCNDLRNYTDADEPSNIFPCWDHEFLIDQTRNIPLRRSSITVDLEHWKRVRWLAWAAENEMISSEELLTDIKTYRLVSPFKQVSEHVIYRQPSKIDIADVMPEPIASLIPEKKGKEKEIKKGEKSPKGSQKSGGSKSSKGKEKKTKDVNSNTVDPSFWVDYKKLSSKINTLIVYYKPSAFKTKIEISDINQKQQVEKKGELEWQVLVNPFTFKISRNEPIYIFTESIDCKLIVLSFSQVGYSEILYPEKGTETPPSGLDRFTECDFCMASFVKRVRRNMTNGEENKEYVPVAKMEPVLVAYTRPVSNFVLEDYDWKTDALGNTVISLNTYGSKTATLNLGPGRKILKLWIKSNTPYTLQIFSDTPISIGSLETVISSMSEESQLLEDMCIQIANSFAKVVEAFGNSHFSEKLKNFYSSYKPQTHLTKSECVVLHNTFYDLLWELVEDSVGTKDLQALKVLFLKWQLPSRTHYPEECNLCNCYNEDDFEYLKATERYVTKIQAFFRGIYDRSYLKRHSTRHREYKNISESLFNIYSAIFSLQRRFETCPNLVRAFLEHPNLNKVKEKYHILQDLDNVLTVIKVDSTVKLAEKQWCLICRQQFFVESQSPIPIKINLFCDLDDYVVRVINNDTTEEIKRYTNNVGVSQYKSNNHGYTALCYIWATTAQILNYKLIFATKKEVEYDKISLSPINVEINSFNGMYIPNVKNIICTHVVNVRCQRGLLTVHFSTSYNNAIISLRLYDDSNKLVQEVVGNGEAIIAAVHITNKNKPFYDVPMLKTGGPEKGRRATMRATIKLHEKSRLSINEKKSSIKLNDNQAMAPPPLRPPSPHTEPGGFQSQKPHVHPYYHMPETKDVKRNFRVERTIVYRIEASVLDDSWPLNFEEWKNVTSSRDLESSRLRANSDISTLSKTSVISLKKIRKQRSTIRAASASKPPSPYWIMETIQHQDENLEIVKDFGRLSEIMAIKESWCANDVERPKRAHEIRKEFLKAHEFPNPYTPEDATDIRSLEESAFAPKILPPLDLPKYMIKDPDEVKTKRFKNTVALEMDTKREEALIEEAGARQLQNMKKIDELLEQQMETYHTVTNWFNEIRHESSQMIAYAMKLRTEYINETLEAQRIENERKEKEKKVKKGKKDKKAKLFRRPSATSQTAEVPDEPQARLPFKEWSDKEIREEKWDDPKLISLREELLERFGQSHDYYHDQEPDHFYDQLHDYQQDDGYDYHRKNSSTRGSKTYQEGKRRFQDQQVVQLPQSVKLYEWKEISEVFPNAKLVVYLKNDEYPDLITDNKHLLHSEFMRNFISSIHTLIYLGNTTRFTTQFTGPNFSATTGDSPWRPWFHIYSNNSACTRREHDPTINKIGKYVVRLFWLGTWRKIYVDDRLPVDIFQKILLPSVVKLQEETGEGSKVFNLEVVQLWPYLLAKALLKIASLTWFQDKEIVDFDIIHCLTGWIPQKINTVGLPISEVWKICWAYTRHYSCINEITSEKGEELKTSKSGSQMVAGKEDRENNDNTSKENDEEKTEGHKNALESDSCDLIKIVDKAESAHYVVARCNDLRTFDSDQKIQNFSPCWSHEFLVDQTRDGPLIKPRLTKDLENWKRLRWLSWAKKKGLVSEDDVRPENFHYKLVSAFRKVTEPVVCEQPTRLSDQLSLDSSEELILAKKEKKGKKLKKSVSQKSVSQLRSISQHKNVTDRKQSKIKKNLVPKIAADEKIDKTDKQTESDPSFWVDYKDLSSQINTLTVYFKPCRMNTKIRISNLSNEGKWNVGMLSTWTLLQNPLTPKISRNEPIYIFSESLDPQFLVINLSQTGYTKILEPEKDEVIIVSPVESKMDNTMECEFCLASLVKRIKVNVTKEEIKHYVSLDRFEPQLVTHDRSCSHIVLEKYNWKTDKLGDTVTSLKTYGEKTATLQFGSGRTILKLWIKSDNPYVVFLFSDDPIVVGSLETIIMCMAKESLLFKSKIHEISNSFSKLVSAFAAPEFSLRLKEFYRSYKPEECLTKAECLMLHDTFFELMMELIKFTMGAEEMYALRILLFRWQRNPHVEYPDCYNLCNCYDEDDLEYLKLLEKYIVLIQAFLRGTIDRYFMKHHNPTFAYHNILLESLHNIYTDIFSIENRFNACSDLVRALLAHPNLNKIKEKYQIFNDLENVLTVKKFTHNVSLVEGSWAPICRQQFFVNSDEPIPVKINLFCDHAEYVVRVIDNDTNNEIKRYTNNVTVSEYKKNEKGYTVFCYAWSATSKQLSCKLCFATKKEVQQDRLTILRVGTEANSFYGMYIPNIDNRICKYSVAVWSESALLSAHFACSYPDVIIKLKVFDNNGKLLHEVMGKGDIVLPAIILEYRQTLDGRRSPSLTSVISLKQKRKRRQSMFPGSRLTFGSQQRYSFVPKGSDGNISESGSRSGLIDSKAKLPRKSLYSRKSIFSKKSSESQVRGSLTSIKSNESSTMFNEQGMRQDTPDLEYLQSLYDQQTEVRNIPKHRRSRYSMGLTDVTPNLKFRSFTSRYTFGSQNTLKTVPHVLPYDQTPQKAEEKKKLKITHPTQYIIEVSVVNDSWPLNSDEWGNLEHPAPDGHVSTFLSSMKDVPRPSSRTSLRSKCSVRSTRKSVFYGQMTRKSIFHTPKPSNVGEMFTGMPRRNQPQMGKPYWIMQTIVNHGQNVNISKHTGREMQMNSFKTKWSERDPTRAKRGQQIRAEFLRQNKLLNAERLFGEEIYTKRSLVKDDVSAYVLPPLNLSRYMTKTVDADNRKFKNSAIVEKEARIEAALFEKSEDEWRDKCQRLDDFTNQQMINLNIVNKWFNGVRKKSYRMMESAMRMKISLYEALTGRDLIADAVEIEKKSKRRSFK